MNKVIYICLLVIVYLFFRTLKKTEFFDNKHFFIFENNKFKFIINHITKYTITKPEDPVGPPFMKLMFLDGKKGNIFMPEFHKENKSTIKLFFKPKPNNIMTLLHLPRSNLSLYIDDDTLFFRNNSNIIDLENKVKFYVLSFIALSIDYDKNKVKIHFNGFEKEIDIDNIVFEETSKNPLYIGVDNTGSDYFKGFIGNIVITKKYDSRDEICNYSIMCDSDPYNKTLTICKFDPEGNTVNDCIDRCQLLDTCSVDKCSQICAACIDPVMCKWYVAPNDKRFIKQTPNAVHIKAIPFSEKVKLIWKSNTELENKAPIENYLVIVEREIDSTESKRISIHNNPTCKNCVYEVTGLENQESYNIHVRAVNSHGIGDMSNVETITPIGIKTNAQISPSLLDSNEDILNQIKESNIDYECNSLENKVNMDQYDDGHILSKDYVNMHDYLTKN
jgi:hypothetical protein